MGWLDYDDKKANEAGGNREPIPVGTELSVRITGAEAKPTSTGGKMVQIEFSVIDGAHKKRKFWHNLHIVNKNENMQHRDRRTLKDIAKIVHADIEGGEAALRNLKGRDLLLKITEHEQDNYNGQTRVRERVGNFRTDPEANNSTDSYDDEDIPF